MFETASQQALRLIDKAERLLVVTHVVPDGDAIGSLLGLGHILRRLGKANIKLACDDGVPEKLAFLPGTEQVVQSVEGPFDLVISVDCSDERRGGQIYYEAVYLANGRPPVINIDHHITNTDFGMVNIVLPDTVSTTEILLRLMKAWGVALDQAQAVCLLTGLITDTLCFRTANVTSGVMRVAAELMSAGADLAYITSQTVNRKPFESVRFWGTLLKSVKLEEGVVSVHVSAEERHAAGYRAAGDASVVSFLVTAWEADMAVSFVETDEGRVEISLRAKKGFDVSKVALALGGGGHPAAAGCTVDGPLESVLDQVLTMLKEARRKQLEP